MENPKTAVITGASSGIGEELSKLLFKKGYSIYALSRREPEIKCNWIKTDFRDFNATQSSINQLNKSCKSIDLLYHCAGIMPTQKSSKISFKECSDSFNINTVTPIVLTSSLIKPLARANGSVIAISSIAAELNIPGELSYSSTKAALNKAFQNFASEFTRLGIKFIIISPGMLDTPMTFSLNEEQKIFMKSKVSVKNNLDTSELAKYALNIHNLPLEASGSRLYFGGIKK